jgi:hypothetical protein
MCKLFPFFRPPKRGFLYTFRTRLVWSKSCECETWNHCSDDKAWLSALGWIPRRLGNQRQESLEPRTFVLQLDDSGIPKDSRAHNFEGQKDSRGAPWRIEIPYLVNVA